ncbi:MAG: uroporphyrinogen synthase [Betaproteobacteria bacterium]|nr:uroporphyrinogen synthase [Betaproteobacteria bacterium]
MKSADPLAGRGIVVTRPAHQAMKLADLLREAGARPIPFPVIEIADLDDPRPFAALIDRLDEFDLAIFVSPNAVGRAMTLITSRRELPRGLTYAAVGSGSVRQLKKFGVTDVIAPARFDSEALLALPAMAGVAGKRIAIFRGVGGREVLGEALTARGAHVEYAECYRRACPSTDPAPLFAAWDAGQLDAITVTSSEGLHNLYAMIGPRGRQRLLETALFAPHARIAGTAQELHFSVVITTPQGDDGLLAGLRQWFGGKR